MPALALQARLAPGYHAPARGGWPVIDAIYSHTVISGVPVVAAPAEIDITTADQLRAALMHAASSRHPVVVVDMTSTRFCDSAGLHTLLAAHKRARADDSELRLLIPADGTVPRILTLTGIDRLLPCYTHLHEALATTPCGSEPAAGSPRTRHEPQPDPVPGI